MCFLLRFQRMRVYLAQVGRSGHGAEGFKVFPLASSSAMFEKFKQIGVCDGDDIWSE
jgi:hypothetical protein